MEENDIISLMSEDFVQQKELFERTSGYRGMPLSRLMEAAQGNPFAAYTLAKKFLASANAEEQRAGMDYLAGARTLLDGDLAAGRATEQVQRFLVTVLLEQGRRYEKGALCPAEGIETPEQARHAAFLCYQNAHELDPGQAANLVRCLQEGIGTEPDERRARNVLEAAARAGGTEPRLLCAFDSLDSGMNLAATQWLQNALESADAAERPGLCAVARYLLANLGETDETGAALDLTQTREALEPWRSGETAAWAERALQRYPMSTLAELEAVEKAKQEREALERQRAEQERAEAQRRQQAREQEQLAAAEASQAKMKRYLPLAAAIVVLVLIVAAVAASCRQSADRQLPAVSTAAGAPQSGAASAAVALPEPTPTPEPTPEPIPDAWLTDLPLLRQADDLTIGEEVTDNTGASHAHAVKGSSSYREIIFQTDGKYDTLTGSFGITQEGVGLDPEETARVEFYADDVLVYTAAIRGGQTPQTLEIPLHFCTTLDVILYEFTRYTFLADL